MSGSLAASQALWLLNDLFQFMHSGGCLFACLAWGSNWGTFSLKRMLKSVRDPTTTKYESVRYN